MAKSNTLDNQLLALIYNATTAANLAVNATSAPLTIIYLALHTADPTSAGNQSTSEAAYTGYARVAVARTSAGFTVSGATVTLTANAVFPAGTGGTGTATFFSTGYASSGAGEILHSGPISPAIVMGAGVIPQLTTATNITES